MWRRTLALSFILALLLYPGIVRAGEIHEAVKEGSLSRVKALLEANPRLVNSLDRESGLRPLHIAVSTSQKQILKLLLEKKADVNATSTGDKITGGQGLTALHVAASEGNEGTGMARLLIAGGSDVNAQDKAGMTPLHYALSNTGWEVDSMVKLLVQSGADVGIRDSAKTTPLELAKKNSPELVPFMVKFGTGGVVIFEAIAKNDMLKLESLLEANPELANAQNDKTGETPLHWAAGFGRLEMARVLIAKKANVNARSNNGSTPLHNAAGWGQLDIAQLLIAHKANVNAKTNSGLTPLAMALHKGRVKTSELLRKHGAKE
jgi:tankyrase